jgi:cytochrome c553
MAKRYIATGLFMMALSANTAQAQVAPAPPPQVQPCVVCHGEDGHGTAPLFPDLAAQHLEYLALQMELFRSGERPSHIMNTLTRTMSDEDIKIAVEYYANLPRCN